MKKWKKILDFLSRLFVRIAHIAEHVTCDDVPHIEEKEE